MPLAVEDPSHRSTTLPESPVLRLRVANRSTSYPLLLPLVRPVSSEVCQSSSNVNGEQNCTTDDLASNIVIGWHPVGQGGFSDVYQGKYTRTIDGGCFTSLVALKVLRITETCDLDRALKHLRREAFVWSQVDNPFIAKFHQITFVGDRPALIIDWYGHGVATKYLKDKPIETKLMIICDIANGIAYLHSKNIIHGDIKGNNILISDEGRGLITDFGLARVMGSPTGHTTSVVSGSIPWMAPELLTSFSGPIAPSKASDVWAFGCTAYELLSDEVPYSQLRNPFAVTNTIHQGKNPLDICEVQSISPVVRNMLERCWMSVPSDRPTMIQIIELLSLH